MAGKPSEYTVTKLINREEWDGKEGPMVTIEMLLEGQSTVYKGHVPKDKAPDVQDGSTIEGWLNEGGKFGFATGGRSASSSPNGGSRRDDATGRSIERQVAAKAAAEMAAAAGGGQTGGPQVAANFEVFFDTVLAKIQGQPPSVDPASSDPAGDAVPF
jgi:hypothetical protein